MVPTLTAKRHAKCLTTKALSTEEGPVTGAFLFLFWRRYDAETKSTFWTEVDAWLTDSLYVHPKFKEFFDERAGTCTDGLWPTVTIRQIMWALKMKPLQKQRWETVFDRRDI